MLASPNRIPRATYRLQFTPEFGFDQGRKIVPYLVQLGISEIYSSPLFQASTASSHGYDVNDYNRISASLGGREGLDRLSADLRKDNLGLLMDFVPNHMGIDGEHNRWWRDVLENGPESKFAPYFDIEWHPRLERLNDRVLVPMLDNRYGPVLESGRLCLRYDDQGGFYVQFARLKLPICPKTYDQIFEQNEAVFSAKEPKARLHELLNKLALAKAGNLEANIQGLKDELAKLIGENTLLRESLNNAINKINGSPGNYRSFEILHRLLEHQNYRLAYWKVGAHEVNYRRFFAVDTLIGMKMENVEVFDAAHQLLAELIGSETISGIRLDHIDGLWNPAQYLDRLEELVRHKHSKQGTVYTLVEKILAVGESLPESWAVHGTTGYEFAASLIDLFLDRKDEPAWTRIYENFTGEKSSSRDLTYSDKLFILEEIFPNAVNNLALELDTLIEPDWNWRDLSLHDLKTALRHLLAGLSVYRTYRMPGEEMIASEKASIHAAVEEGLRRNPCVDPVPIRFLGRVLTGEYPPADYSNQQREPFERWVCKLQQATGAVMAKSVEDTHFFRYVRMMGANEVGSHPSHFGEPISEFHRANQLRRERTPYCLLTTSTHDTKMSEDARARLFALAELPDEWESQLKKWHEMNGHARSIVEGRSAPDAREEYLLFQALLAAWPLTASSPDDSFRQRLKAYFRKAQGEAKLNTAWTYPHEGWHRAGEQYIDAILNSSEFIDDFVPFARRISYRGMIFSLAQTVLKLTCPGVPDIYQGNELWDFSLVDPDNRRPVDFDARLKILEQLNSRGPSDLFLNWQDGGIKMQVTRKLLLCRKDMPDLFTVGQYEPLELLGKNADHFLAFLRKDKSRQMAVVVPRRLGAGEIPSVKEIGSETELRLPFAGQWKNILTGELVFLRDKPLPLKTLFKDWPVAVLLSP